MCWVSALLEGTNRNLSTFLGQLAQISIALLLPHSLFTSLSFVLGENRVGIAPCTISERREELLSLMWWLGHFSIWHRAAKSAIQATTKKARGTMALFQCLVGKDGPNVALKFIRTQESADKKRIRCMFLYFALISCEQYCCIYLPRSRLQQSM